MLINNIFDEPIPPEVPQFPLFSLKPVQIEHKEKAAKKELPFISLQNRFEEGDERGEIGDNDEKKVSSDLIEADLNIEVEDLSSQEYVDPLSSLRKPADPEKIAAIRQRYAIGAKKQQSAPTEDQKPEGPTLKEEQKAGTGEETKEEEPSPSPKPAKQLSPFQQFFNQKKAELLAEHPNATNKELILLVTPMWLALN